MSVPSPHRPAREWVLLVLAFLICGAIVVPLWQAAGARGEFLTGWTPERLGKLFEGDAPEDPILEGLLRRALAGDAEALRRLPGYLNATDASETTRADALRRLSEGA